MKIMATTTALILGLSATTAFAEQPKKDSGLWAAVQAGFALKSCADKIRVKYAIDGRKTVNVEHMNADGPPDNGAWDVRFTGSTTEKATNKTTAFEGVCHVHKDAPTTIDAHTTNG